MCLQFLHEQANQQEYFALRGVFLEDDKTFLQTIKLEISKNIKLTPYERLVFHKILSETRSPIGKDILLKELKKGPQIRYSAIAALVFYKDKDVLTVLLPYLLDNITDNEKIFILRLASEIANEEHLQSIMSFITDSKDTVPSHIIELAFHALKDAPGKNQSVITFLNNIITNDDNTLIRQYAIIALSSFTEIAIFDKLSKDQDDNIIYSVLCALDNVASHLTEISSKRVQEEDKIYTYLPENEEKEVLDIRVLLSRMTNFFDSYSPETKTAFISAMITCNHREYLIYVMKTLTSRDSNLITMVLYCLYKNITKLHDPDKLFRNLIALSLEDQRFNSLVVDTIVKYFSTIPDTTRFHLFQEKIYSYFVVTLETYFETYRKEFMISGVLENQYPESFQKIRKFILEHFSPELKKSIVLFLSQEDDSTLPHILEDMSRWIKHLNDDDKENLSLLMQILLDKDPKSRAISSSRLDDLNFEKLYLRNRILRLCRIISALGITEASSILVNIYNYVKKYFDKEIYDVVVTTLAHLNYSYMLGEIEIMINTGDEHEQMSAMKLISLFTEQRSLNILFEIIKQNIKKTSFIVLEALATLIQREIEGNITASQLLKAVLENSNDNEIRRLAILGLGKCGFENDIEFLNSLFHQMQNNEPKEYVIRALADILSQNKQINVRLITKYFQEYLKDPSIRVRIYSCLMLADLGNKDALRSLRDMLVIKNKNIQREILCISSTIKSLGHSYFLLSLIKQEYGIMWDLIPPIISMSEIDLKDIESFIVNVFRKFEAPDIELISTKPSDIKEVDLTEFSLSDKCLLQIRIIGASTEEHRKLPQLINDNIFINSIITSQLFESGGEIVHITNDAIIAYYDDPIQAVNSSIAIIANINHYNMFKAHINRVHVELNLSMLSLSMYNDEVLIIPYHAKSTSQELPIRDSIIINGPLLKFLDNKYVTYKIPHIITPGGSIIVSYFELHNSINFPIIVQTTMKHIIDEDKKRIALQQQREEEMKRLKRASRSVSSAAIARELEEIGRKMHMQFEEIDYYMQHKSNDRELLKNVKKMLKNAEELYKVEISRIIIE